MRVVIIEDEAPAANRLCKLLENINEEIEVVKRLDSVERSVQYLQSADNVDLIFMDIQLADGLSLDIFEQTEVKAPVIFTTAFDQYTLKAFKVNSVDYLLKPIDEMELQHAIDKYRQIYKADGAFTDKLTKLVREMNTHRYKERLLIRRGQQLNYLKTEEMAYCFADGKLCFAIDFVNNKYLIENTLTELEEQLEPNRFFRVNRHLMVNINSVKRAHVWLGGRLKLELSPSTNTDTIVSRERVQRFKEWLGQ